MTYVLLFAVLLANGQVATHSQTFPSAESCVAEAQMLREAALISASTVDAKAMCLTTKLNPDRKSKPT